MSANDYMTHAEAVQVDGCPVCNQLDCVCPPEHNPGRSENSLTLERTENLAFYYDHCRFCGYGGRIWYGLCDQCNEEQNYGNSI